VILIFACVWVITIARQVMKVEVIGQGQKSMQNECIIRASTAAWLGSRVVSVLDSGAEGQGSNHSRDAVG